MIKFSPTLISLCLLVSAAESGISARQDAESTAIALQPFAAQVRQIESALDYLGSPLSARDRDEINRAIGMTDQRQAVNALAAILDRYTLAAINVDSENHVSATAGLAKPNLVQAGTTAFLVKVKNPSGIRKTLSAVSPNSGPVYQAAFETSWHPPGSEITAAKAQQRWADFSFYDQPPFREKLSGLALEYRVLLVGSRDAGSRTASLRFQVDGEDGVSSEAISIAFTIAEAHAIRLNIMDENGAPTTASFQFRDALGHIYPSPAKRLAPDLFFQPQVYRMTGESILLPPGLFTVNVTGGPEYIGETRRFTVSESGPQELSFQLKRWIDPSKYGWYSGDHHIHAAGCAHYRNPTEGVEPKDMDRQVRGEHLNVGCVLNWAPGYYYQKQFFRQRQDDPLSTRASLLHYDLEVSGFPSSHAGHLVLLNLREQDYPGTKRIEDWPSWDLPVLRWAKAQGAIAGFAHSGWGLELRSATLPNYDVPAFDGIGANEYIVNVTYPNTVDFISAGDTPYPSELNIWYHTLNVGFRTRISGETDFPCIDDSRVGEGRTYAQVSGNLSYTSWVNAIRNGASYVSDGRSHLMNFKVDKQEVGANDSELRLTGPATLRATVNAAAFLELSPDEKIRALPFDSKPYWHLERARVGNTRRVPVEVILNGRPIARQELVADGAVRELTFNVPVVQSGWIALRILGSAHTNPIFVQVAGKPIRTSRRSASWCIAAVNQCWSQKAPHISSREASDARAAYDHALAIYQNLLTQSGDDE